MIDERSLIDFVTAQRWFGAKTRSVTHARLLDRVPLSEDPPLSLELVEIGFDTGVHDVYQLLTDGAFDAVDEPAPLAELLPLLRGEAVVAGETGTARFFSVGARAPVPGAPASVRLIGGEQSNSSVVFDDELILKIFRRVCPGLNPELELLRFLTERGFDNIARLVGWYGYVGGPLDATLGILQGFVAGVDGFELAVESMGDGAGGILPHLRRLGQVTGRLHSLLGSESADPAFAPEVAPAEALGLLAASLDEAIDRVFRNLPGDAPALDPIRGRAEELRERLRLLTRLGDVGPVIRQHGDFHLGQALWTGDDWVIVDFEGEPARSLPERRRKHSALRDVAGMLRSLSYAASTAGAPDGWESEARAEFLAGYLATAEPSLVPPGASLDRLLAVFELEKAVYELGYELDNRPEWVGIPAAAIAAILDHERPA